VRPAVLEVMILSQGSQTRPHFTPRRILIEGDVKHSLTDLRHKLALNVDFVSLSDGGKRLTKVHESKQKIRMKPGSRFFVNCYHTERSGKHDH
jgi:hypothetical protein